MDRPNRNAKITTGSQKLMAPVGETLKIACRQRPPGHHRRHGRLGRSLRLAGAASESLRLWVSAIVCTGVGVVADQLIALSVPTDLGGHMTEQPASLVYPARLEVDYQEQLNRLTTLFRVVLIIPIGIVFAVLTAGATQTVYNQSGEAVRTTSGGITAGLFLATLLMIVFRQRYPRWWFDFALELTRFGTRIGAYLVLLTDQYPSTVEEQSVHLQIDYPDVQRDLNRWLPLVKWLLAIPHFLVLIVLSVVALFAVIIAWFAILFTGHYPRGLFDFVLGVGRWWLRVQAYAILLVTDRYPPFSLA
jgi:Domain of unknown function (DUF4389)